MANTRAFVVLAMACLAVTACGIRSDDGLVDLEYAEKHSFHQKSDDAMIDYRDETVQHKNILRHIKDGQNDTAAGTKDWGVFCKWRRTTSECAGKMYCHRSVCMKPKKSIQEGGECLHYSECFTTKSLGEACDCVGVIESTKKTDKVLPLSDPGHCTCTTKKERQAAKKEKKAAKKERKAEIKKQKAAKSMAWSPGWPPAGIVAMLMVAHGFVTDLYT